MKALYSLVGMKHRGTMTLVSSLPRGEPLTLIREPGNAYDPRAIQVWARDQMLGYIAAKQNAKLAALMDRSGQPFPATLCVTPDRWPMVEVIEITAGKPT